jgi:inorganic pyrophosphatase
MIVEIPRGSRSKYEIDHATGELVLDRMLFTATRYPADYGFIPTRSRRTAIPSTPWSWSPSPPSPGVGY